jgi:hypothetical protein
MMIVIYLSSNAQDVRSDVNTPKGTPVIAYITEEDPEWFREYNDSVYRETYPNAIFLKHMMI